MPDFEYVAREMSGRQVTGVLTAASKQDAVRTLAGQSLFPIQIDTAKTAESTEANRSKRVRSRHLVALYSQLADLLHSGVPLLRSLEILEQQASHPGLARVLQEVREQVADGTRLADAMNQHPRIFNELAVSMVRAGEEGGFLEDVLKRIATFTEHQEDLKSRVVGALAYPLFLLVMGIVVVTGMLLFFVPKFAPIFDGLAERGQLPLPTKLLLGFSQLLQNHGLWVIAGIVAIGWWGKQLLNSEEGRRRADTLRLKIWGLGPILRNLAIARFCRILGTLLRNGVPLLPSLRIAKDATGNKLLSEAIGTAAENISSGKTLARPLAASGQFSREVIEMITVGEEANNLEKVLLDIADNMERRTNRELELYVRLLEPIMLLVMATLILFVMVALLLPVFQSASAFN